MYASWASLLAGVFDVVENIGLLTMLLGQEVFAPVPQITSLFAASKFALIVLSFLVSMAVLLWPSRQFTSK